MLYTNLLDYLVDRLPTNPKKFHYWEAESILITLIRGHETLSHEDSIALKMAYFGLTGGGSTNEVPHNQNYAWLQTQYNWVAGCEALADLSSLSTLNTFADYVNDNGITTDALDEDTAGIRVYVDLLPHEVAALITRGQLCFRREPKLFEGVICKVTPSVKDPKYTRAWFYLDNSVNTVWPVKKYINDNICDEYGGAKLLRGVTQQFTFDGYALRNHGFIVSKISLDISG